MDCSDTLQVSPNPRKIFSGIGIACLVILAISLLFKLGGMYLVNRFAPQLNYKPWYIWAITFIPMYFIAVPIGLAIFKRIPATKIETGRMSFGSLVLYFIMCIAIMMIGNIIGNLLSMAIGALRGAETVNPIGMLVTGSDFFYIVLVVVILAPIIEEFIFRKLIIDRLRIYGEGTAIMVSSLMFGAFHGNLYQFFYAFGLGAIFAFIYIKTGRLGYPVILHMVINFMGSVIAPLILKGIDLDALFRIGNGDTDALIQYISEKLLYLLGYGLYVFALLGLAIAGIVLLIVRRKSFTLKPASLQLEKGTGFKTAFLNPGMLLFTAGTLAVFIMQLL